MAEYAYLDEWMVSVNEDGSPSHWLRLRVTTGDVYAYESLAEVNRPAWHALYAVMRYYPLEVYS